MDRWLKEPEVLSLLGIGRTTLYRLVKNGKIEKYKLGRLNRYSMEEIEKFMKGAKA